MTQKNRFMSFCFRSLKMALISMLLATITAMAITAMPSMVKFNISFTTVLLVLSNVHAFVYVVSIFVYHAALVAASDVVEVVLEVQREGASK